MDGHAFWCGIDLCRSVSPCICWRKYVQLPKLQSSAVHIRPTPNERTMGNPQRAPSSCPNRRFGSWGLGHHDRTAILGMACFYNTDNWKEREKKPMRMSLHFEHVAPRHRINRKQQSSQGHEQIRCTHRDSISTSGSDPGTRCGWVIRHELRFDARISQFW